MNVILEKELIKALTQNDLIEIQGGQQIQIVWIYSNSHWIKKVVYN